MDRAPKIFRLSLCIPTGHDVTTDFSLSVSMLVLALNKKPAIGYDTNSLKIFNTRSSLLPRSRHQLVQRSLDAGCTHLLFIDSDQTFPAFMAHRLASHDVDVVACNIATKCIPSAPTARNESKDWWGGDVVFSDQKKGLEKVWRVGMGVMMIKAEVFQKIPPPWFEIIWRPEIKDYLGEDWYFCEKLEKAGISIHVDHSLSREVGHLGYYNFTHDVIGSYVQGQAVKDENMGADFAGITGTGK